MSIFHGKSDRRILPRWQASSKAPQSGGFSSLRAPKKTGIYNNFTLPEVLDSFNSSPDIGVAAEVLSVALLESNEKAARNAINFIEQHADHAPSSLLRLSRSVFDTDNTPSVASNEVMIKNTRKLLRLNQNNPMLWSDMARHFASLGRRERANRYMRVALQQAPDHCWMLRTAARFFVHQQDAEAAHKLLAEHPRTKQDPWLIAAELACAQVAGRAPRFWKQANEILKFDKFSPRHISELATAVAMMELESSSGRKKARKLITKGLLAPTENTLAQVFWAKQQKHLGNGFGLDALVREVHDAYEAEFRRNLEHGDLLAALKAAQTWSVDEPFAARPKAEIAYIASLFDDHDLTSEMERAVLRIDGETDPTLRMNALFSRLSSGSLTIESDGDELLKIRASLVGAIEQRKDEAYHAIANLGLWQYRYGSMEEGRELYQTAISIAEKRHSLESAAEAAVFAAREALLRKDPNAFAVLVQAKELSKRSKSKSSEFYLRKLDALAASPEKSSEILSPSSAERFLIIEDPKIQPKNLSFQLKRDGSDLLVFFPSETIIKNR